MTFSKTSLVLGVAALLTTTTLAEAQSARFSDIDRDGNGQLSYSELVSAFGRRGADQVWSQGDGRELTRGDIRSQNARMNDDDDDDDGGRSGGGRDDDDDDGGRSGGGRDDDDDDGGRSGGGRDDDDDDGGRSGGGRDDDDDDGGRDDDDD